MTTRKPPHMSFPDWVEQQIRIAEQDGAFQDLPGKGKPIPNIDRPQHEMTWVVDKLRRENVDVACALPPALALAKEAEVLPARLLEQRTEPRVRAVVEELNTRIRHAQRQPQDGPPFRVRTVNVDDAISQWRAAIATSRHAAVEQPTQVEQPFRRARIRRLFGRGQRTRE
jgi:hypothetical protein